MSGPARMADDACFEPEIERMPRADLERLQEDRLLELVPYVYERSALVRSTWDAAGVHPRDVRSLDDFRARVPFTDKDAIRRFRDAHGDPFGGICCVPADELTTIVSTSGTTGDPTLLPDRWDGWSTLSRDAARFWWGMGIRPGDHGLGVWTFRTPAYYESFQMCGAIPVLFDPVRVDWPEVFDLIDRYQIALVWLSGPDTVALHRLADRYDLAKIFAPVKAVKFAGSPLGTRMHQRMTEEWGMRVFMGTSAGDVGLSFECPVHDGCHIWEDNVLAEHLDPDGDAPAAPGSVGELVVTALDNPVAPLVRYRSDDLVRFTTETCACGRTHARQWPVGRKGDEVVVEGRVIAPQDVWTALEALPETEAGVFQVVRPRREMDELRLRVGYDPARTGADLDGLGERVREAVHATVGVDPVLQLVPEREILGQAQKIVRVVKA